MNLENTYIIFMKNFNIITTCHVIEYILCVIGDGLMHSGTSPIIRKVILIVKIVSWHMKGVGKMSL